MGELRGGERVNGCTNTKLRCTGEDWRLEPPFSKGGRGDFAKGGFTSLNATWYKRGPPAKVAPWLFPIHLLTCSPTHLSVSGRLLTGFLMHRLFPCSIFHPFHGYIRFCVPGVFAERPGSVPDGPYHHLIVDNFKIDGSCLESLANLLRDGDLPLPGELHCLCRHSRSPHLSNVVLHNGIVILSKTCCH